VQRLEHNDPDKLIFRERWYRGGRLLALTFLGVLLACFLGAAGWIVSEAVRRGTTPWGEILGLGIATLLVMGKVGGKIGKDLILGSCCFDRRSGEVTAQDALFGLTVSRGAVSSRACHVLWSFDGYVHVPRQFGGGKRLFLDRTLYLYGEGEQPRLLAKGNPSEIAALAQAAADFLDLDLVETAGERTRVVRASRKGRIVELLRRMGIEEGPESPGEVVAARFGRVENESFGTPTRPDGLGQEPAQSGDPEGDGYDWGDLTN
jgi:hypothetical protein